MCIAFWTLENSEYALILCANRDEYLSRPTANAHFHASHEPNATDSDRTILSGVDLQAGGTWLGVNRLGRVALLTNITEESAKFKFSRGNLVSSFLSSDETREQFTSNLTRSSCSDYAGFNLLLFTPSSTITPLFYDADLVTNFGGGGAIATRSLRTEERQICGVSNGVDGRDGDTWCKVQKGRDTFAQVLADMSVGSTDEELASRLFDLLTWKSQESPSNRAQLRNSIQIAPLRVTTSISPDAAADGPDYYGTRLSTVLLIRKDGRVLFVERDIWQLDSDGNPKLADPRGQRIFHFNLALSPEKQV